MLYLAKMIYEMLNIVNNILYIYIYIFCTRPTCKSVVHSFSTRSFQIWNAVSNTTDFCHNISIVDYNKYLYSTC